jgi:hypothetical protein
MHKQNAFRSGAWFLVLVLPLWLGSCSKSGSDVVTPAGVEGSWKISAYTINPGVDLFGTGQKSTNLFDVISIFLGADCLRDTRTTFNSNGKVTSTPGAKCTATASDTSPIENNSTWKLDGTKLTINDGKESTVYDLALSGNTMKLSSTSQQNLGDGLKTYTIVLEFTRA